VSAIDPTMSVSGAEWNVGGVGGVGGSAGTTGTQAPGFGAMLGSSLQSLTKSQEDAATASRELATGQATDPTAVVMSVERAQLAMQLASTIRNNAVQAAQSLFQTTV
jgi:flagellar hook-basal body complex protein FliE